MDASGGEYFDGAFSPSEGRLRWIQGHTCRMLFPRPTSPAIVCTGSNLPHLPILSLNTIGLLAVPVTASAFDFSQALVLVQR